jgi:hypothetical protein
MTAEPYALKSEGERPRTGVVDVFESADVDMNSPNVVATDLLNPAG